MFQIIHLFLDILRISHLINFLDLVVDTYAGSCLLCLKQVACCFQGRDLHRSSQTPIPSLNPLRHGLYETLSVPLIISLLSPQTTSRLKRWKFPSQPSDISFTTERSPGIIST